jgi:type I restriction enzyme, S subunit
MSKSDGNHSNLPDEWSVGTMADVIADIVAGTSVNCEDRNFRPGDKRVLKLSAVSKGRFDSQEAKVASTSEHSRLRTPVRSGTVLFTRKNTPELVGDSAYVSEAPAECYLPDLIWEISPKEDIDPRWVNSWLQSPEFRREISRLCAGSSKSMVGVSQDAILESPVSIPPLREQRRIVALLAQWDDAVTKVERLILAKRNRYKGLLRSQIFDADGATDKMLSLTARRVAGKTGWQVCRIGDFAKEVSLTNGSPTLPVLSCTKHKGIVLSDDYFGGRRIYSEDTSGYKIVLKGQFAYATNHLEEGSIGLQDVVDVGLVSPMYTVFEVDETRIDSRFLIAVLKSEQYRQAFEMNTCSSVDRRGGLRWDDFAELPFSLPSLTEQRRLSDLFNGLQADLAAAEALLEALIIQKRGLVQRLLSGEWVLDERYDESQVAMRLAVGRSEAHHVKGL